IIAVGMGGWITFTSWVEVGSDRPALVATASHELSRVTGLGASEHLEVVLAATRTIWPTVDSIAGIAIAALGLTVLIVGRRWRSGGRRYTSGGAPSYADGAGEPDRISDWDS